jgi:hypothetical protein
MYKLRTPAFLKSNCVLELEAEDLLYDQVSLQACRLATIRDWSSLFDDCNVAMT